MGVRLAKPRSYFGSALFLRSLFHMNRLPALAALLVLACGALSAPALAQRAPTVGVVRLSSSFQTTFELFAEASPRAGAVFAVNDGGCNINVPPDCDYALVNVDRSTIRVRQVGPARQEQATDAAGVTRAYSVGTWRDVSRRTTVEIWTRQDGCEVHTCELRGGITVRRGGRSTTVRVVGSTS